MTAAKFAADVAFGVAVANKDRLYRAGLSGAARASYAASDAAAAVSVKLRFQAIVLETEARSQPECSAENVARLLTRVREVWR